ncbi:MAG: hypothetical protein IIC89_05980, partial [Chloroflexi bacterium]|nr:hypothetical protein [Chloroflexota bacterium]
MRLRLAAALVIVLLLSVAVLVHPPSIRSGGVAELEETATASSSSTATPSPAVEPTATPPPTDEPPPQGLRPLPDGARGVVTFRRGAELISLQLPERDEIERRPNPGPPADVTSADGAWVASIDCGELACDIDVSGPDGYTRLLQLEGTVGRVEWSPAGPVLAYVVYYHEGDTSIGSEITMFDTSRAEPTVVLHVGPSSHPPFTWLSTGDLLVALSAGEALIAPNIAQPLSPPDSGDTPNDGHADGSTALLRIAADGSASQVATTAARVMYFYPSPDHARVAFTQSAGDGWRLWTLEADSGSLKDLGNMGSDPAGLRP